MCFILGAALLGSAVIGAAGSMSAASTQAGAAENAANIQQGMFNTVTGNEAPWVHGGQAANSYLNYLMGVPGYQNYNTAGATTSPTTASGTSGANPTGGGQGVASGGFGSLLSPFTTAQFQQYSPMFNFQQQQGIQGTLNQDTSGSGALSGAAQKDLMSFNQNLANTAFPAAFNIWNTQQGNIYQRLAQISQTGQAAGTNQASGASAFGSSIGTQVANAGTAQAGGIVGATNSIGSALPWLMNGSSGSASNLFGGGTSLSSLGIASGADTGPTGYALTGSDRRLKMDIERIGEMPSGLPKYRYRYVFAPESVYIGVMADEAEQMFPEAVSTDASGFKMVDYSRIH
jgi:hypothetical protein